MKTEKSAFLKVATYNIHKGVQGFGPARRLEIHNLGLAIESSWMRTLCVCKRCEKCIDAKKNTSGIGQSCRRQNF
ncbi:MAG: hypothetical protein RJB06_1928 [Pseudomonadota bacterium]